MSPLGPAVAPTATLAEAYKALREFERDCLPVLEPTTLVGTIFADDIDKLVSKKGSDPKETIVREAMRIQVQYCFDDQDDGRVGQLMREREIPHLVVLDRQRVPVGSLNLDELPLPAEEPATP
ncbi:MAG: yhcV [Chloroflexi bacterium]|nr:yhcV [Chloroflexota bacterium]